MHRFDLIRKSNPLLQIVERVIRVARAVGNSPADLREQALRKLGEIEQARGLVDEPTKLAAEVGITYDTLIDLRAGTTNPKSGTYKKIFEAWNRMKRSQSKYEEQSIEDKRRRLIGMVSGMSDFAIELYYPLIMGMAHRDMSAEINGTALEAGDPFDMAMEAARRALGAHPASLNGRGSGSSTAA